MSNVVVPLPRPPLPHMTMVELAGADAALRVACDAFADIRTATRAGLIPMSASYPKALAAASQAAEQVLLEKMDEAGLRRLVAYWVARDAIGLFSRLADLAPPTLPETGIIPTSQQAETAEPLGKSAAFASLPGRFQVRCMDWLRRVWR